MDERAPTKPSTLRKFALLVSAATCVAVTVCYWRQPDWLAPVTLVPAWCWLVLGLTLTGFAFTRKHKFRGSTVLALWVAFAVMFVEEARSIARLARAPEAAWRGASQQGRVVRVVSLNCHVGNKKAAAEVAACKPDIVLLQESPSREHLARLSRDFFGDDGEFIWGGDTAILARGRLQPSNAKGTSHFVHAVVELPDNLKVDVISVRLSPPVFRLDFWRPGFWRDHRDKRRRHRRQIQEVVDEIKSNSRDLPVIVGGDFNAPPNDGALAALRQRLYDTFHRAGRGWGATGTSRFPLFRVDQIWASRDLHTKSVAARRTIHSDHRMVICDLNLPE